MTIPLVIIGCGGFGREVLSLIRKPSVLKHGLFFEGFADDSPSFTNVSNTERLGFFVISSVKALADRCHPFAAVIAVGAPSVRRQLCFELRETLVTYPSLIHPDTTVGEDVRLDEGVVIAAGARLSTNIEVGSHVHIDQNATLGHDICIGPFVRINPQACISGSVRIGEGALIGANATILPGLCIGANAVVGAGACVTHNVEPGQVVKGVPAR